MRLSNSFPGSSFWLRAICRRSHFQSRAAGGPLHLPPKIRLKLEVARQASSQSLCASVRAVPWEDEAEQQLSRLALSACELSADVRIFKAGLLEAPCTDHLRYVGSLREQDKQAAPVSVPLCEQCHGQMRLSKSFPGELFLPASYLQTFAFLERGCRRTPDKYPQVRLKFGGARQATSPNLCASVRAVPWADEAEQQLSMLALSACGLSADIRIFRAWLPDARCTDPQSYV